MRKYETNDERRARQRDEVLADLKIAKPIKKEDNALLWRLARHCKRLQEELDSQADRIDQLKYQSDWFTSQRGNIDQLVARVGNVEAAVRDMSGSLHRRIERFETRIEAAPPKAE